MDSYVSVSPPGGAYLLAYKADDSGKTGLIVVMRAGTYTDLFDEWTCVPVPGDVLRAPGRFLITMPA